VATSGQAIPTSVDNAKRLIDTKTADSSMSALTFVMATSDTTVDFANNNLAYSDATVLGITLGSVAAGGQVEILLFGKLEDPFFSYPVNDILFLTTGGSISNTAPTTIGEHVSTIGYSLGAGSIFLNIEKPIIL